MTAPEGAARLHARRCGAGWIACCPAHDDRSPSLSIRAGRDGRILLRCWAGCETAAVLAAAGLAWRDVCGDSRPPSRTTRRRMRREQHHRARAEAAARDRRLAAGRALDAARRAEQAAAEWLQAAGPGDDAAWVALVEMYAARESAVAVYVAA